MKKEDRKLKKKKKNKSIVTFSNERFKKYARRHKKLKGYNLDNAIATEAVKHFLENWRKEHKKSVRTAIVTGKKIGRAHV